MDTRYAIISDNTGLELGLLSFRPEYWMDENDIVSQFEEHCTIWASNHGFSIDELRWEFCNSLKFFETREALFNLANK